MSFFNSFIRSSGIDFVNLYLGVIIFSAYIIYDTQVIVEKASQGFSDVIIDSLNLFVDFIGLLVRLIILLSKNQQDKERKERERRRR
ncbi:hypothetical protein K502DRAFT_323870 [Neoconidiobolus thromboides FSU 785]|nr:hypothetical protein K502DRAFT_323870 [Neoconidiobolus thromboides FSU 785]